MGILNMVFDGMNSAVDEIADQTLGMKLGKKRRKSTRKYRSGRRRIIVNVYKEIHQHRHFYDYKKFMKK